ncbi:succinate dehydrogenase/fumarate reductase flavoprotein subunit [Mycetocola sp. CAN_C7]|uniref:FAD-dependent oxidoreductase n=1 Tax=Mycetocola sp. CAN_C7 TaxID=2787724 RepID=UPI0018CBA8D5
MENPSNSSAVDVVVLGTGIAGLNAALTAVESGAAVRVIDAAETPGGSSQLSAGMYWTAPDVVALERRIPLGDKRLGARIVADYDGGLSRLRDSGVHVASEPTRDVMTFGVGYSFDVKELLARFRARITAGGGEISLATRVTGIRRDGDTFEIDTEQGERCETLTAGALVIATGGFQGSRSMLAEHMGPWGDRLLHRANPTSNGAGLELATSLGAGTAGNFSSFYGHLMPSPLDAPLIREQFLPFSQYYSDKCLFVNLDGRRFTDETLGDEIINQDLLFQREARGVLIFDEKVRREDATAEPFPNLGVLDRYQVGMDAGARHVDADSLDDLIAQAGVFGIDPTVLAATVRAYIDAVATGSAEADGVPVSPNARPPQNGPFHAIEVQPAITFTFGGIRIDDQARALDAAGQPVSGLFAAGADIGGLSNSGYAGGLAPAFLTGGWAGASATAYLSTLSTGSDHD